MPAANAANNLRVKHAYHPMRTTPGDDEIAENDALLARIREIYPARISNNSTSKIRVE